MKLNQEYIKDIVRSLRKKRYSKEQLSKLKIKLCKKHKIKKIPTDIQIFLNASEKDSRFLKKLLQTKPTRTISGVSVVAIMSKPRKCPHGACIMCPSMVKKGVPQSYTGKEPATRRAIRNKFDPYLQVFNRLEQYVAIGHNFDKIELIIMGGTFPSFPKRYQEDFVMYSFKAMNDFGNMFFKKDKFDFAKYKRFFEMPGDIEDEKRTARILKKISRLKNKNKKSLEAEQKRNEKAKVRCIGLTIETRSDYAQLKHANEMLRLGCTRVELGVQSVYDDVLKKIKRGHTSKDTIDSIRTLKDLGFKINAHYMLGLPGSTRKKDLKGMINLFDTDEYQPDMLKIYPCMVVKESKLYKQWKQKKYRPLTTKKAAELIAEFKEYVPEYCRIMRVQRDIPTYVTEAGVDMTNLRQYVNRLMKERMLSCRCIRCREIGRANPDYIKRFRRKKPEIISMHYPASHGSEFFITAEIGDYILGFCRLRFPSRSLRKEITEDAALIREIHVYGPAAGIGSRKKERKTGKSTYSQHKGIGRRLLRAAEDIAKSYFRNKVVVISGIGVKEYYKRLGYKKQGPYMVKILK